MQQFSTDFKTGSCALQVFTKYLDNKKIPYTLANWDDEKNGIDLWVGKDKLPVEVKNQKMLDAIVIEESDGLRQGWIDTSKAEFLVEVGKDVIHIININQLRLFYSKTKQNYKLIKNDYTKGLYGDVWRGSFRVYPLRDMTGYVEIKKETV